MKKFYFSVLIFILFMLTSAEAATIKAYSLQDFSKSKQSSTYKFKITEDQYLDNGTLLKKDAIISGIVCVVVNAKHCRKNGYFEFIPTELELNGNIQQIYIHNSKAIIYAYKPKDIKGGSEYTAKKVVGIFLPGVPQCISFSQGASKAPEGQKIKGGFYKIYKDSFFSLLERGEDLNIKEGDTVIFKIDPIKK